MTLLQAIYCDSMCNDDKHLKALLRAYVFKNHSSDFGDTAGSRQGLGNWVWQQLSPLIQNTTWPQVGVESIRIRNGKLVASMVGEPIPRRISNVDLTVRLSNDYADMTLDVSGRP